MSWSMNIVYSIALKNVNRKASLLKGNIFTAKDAGLLIKKSMFTYYQRYIFLSKVLMFCLS